MINFLKYTWFYFLISASVIGAGLFSILRWGYTYSIDFVGGTNIDYRFEKDLNKKDVNNIFSSNKINIVDHSINGKDLSVRTKAIGEKDEVKLKQGLEKKFGKATILKSETVGPTLGQETVIKTIIASILGIIGILIYMTYAFKGFNSALSAVLASFHDILVVFGSYSLISHFFGAQMDTLFVTAVLTSMSFSVHDTIVVFDKIREYKNEEGGTPEYFANKALTETMVRSLNNSMTIVFMLLALVLMGGVTIKFFAVTLLIGTITGTYSSPFVATPIFVWLENMRKK